MGKRYILPIQNTTVLIFLTLMLFVRCDQPQTTKTVGKETKVQYQKNNQTLTYTKPEEKETEDNLLRPWNVGRKWHIPLFILNSSPLWNPIKYNNTPLKELKKVRIGYGMWTCESRKKGIITRGPLQNAIYYQVLWTYNDSTVKEEYFIRCYKLDRKLYIDRYGSSPNFEKIFLSSSSFVLVDSSFKNLSPFHEVDSVVIETNYSYADFKVNNSLPNYPNYKLYKFLIWEGEIPPLKKIDKNLYTSLTPTIKDFSELLIHQYKPSPVSIDSASPQEYLQMNGIYLIQSDQVIWIYARDWKKTLTDSILSLPFDDYIFSLTVNEKGIPSDFGCTIDSIHVTKEPMRLLTVTLEGDSIFEIPKYNTSFYERFYNKYVSFSRWEKGKPPYDKPLRSYEEFIKSYPLLIIKDPFNRYIRAFRKEFLPNLFHRNPPPTS